ncbi:hypothetical protein [Paraflavitalea speifideaquila]|uniref:hypothetical protein n=1 Tax=Paraflavitalea speifideaquila TaxID=3076558 RepID=UPI0028E1AD99|nr:hypothetical protein [Paraflavitalea speifideiaquila]
MYNQLPENLNQAKNQGSAPDTVYLPDKSLVILEPGAKIYYPDSFVLSKEKYTWKAMHFLK